MRRHLTIVKIIIAIVQSKKEERFMGITKIAFVLLTLCRLVGSFVLYRITVRYFERRGDSLTELAKVIIFAVMYFVVSRLLMVIVLLWIQFMLSVLIAMLSALA